MSRVHKIDEVKLAWHVPPHYVNAGDEGRRHSRACMRPNVDT